MEHLLARHPVRPCLRAALLAAAALAVVMTLAPSSAVAAPQASAAARAAEARRLNEEVVRLHGEGRHDEAAALAERIVAAREKEWGPDHPYVAHALDLLAGVVASKGDMARAELLYRRILTLREAALGPGHVDVGHSLFALARVRQQQGDTAGAISFYERAAEAWSAALGPEHPFVAEALNNQGTLHLERGEAGRAAARLERALAIWERAGGPDGPGVAAALTNLASAAQMQGELGRAGELFERALVATERTLGNEHPQMAELLTNLGTLWQERGDRVQAEQLHERALRLADAALGPEDPRLIRLLANLGLVYRELSEVERAEALYRRALALAERVLGPRHPTVALTLNNLAELLHDRGELDAARPLYERALAIWAAAGAPEHPDAATALGNLAELYRDRGDPAAAAPLYERALRLQEKLLGPEHRGLSVTLDNLAGILRDRGELDRAEALGLRALSIRERAFGPVHPDVAISLSNLAMLRLVQKRTPEAIGALERAAEIRETLASLALGTGAEERKRALMVPVLHSAYVAVSVHLGRAPDSTAAARLALTSILRSKGRVVDVMADVMATLRRGLDPEDQARMERLAAVHAQLGALVTRGRVRGGPGMDQGAELATEELREALAALHHERQAVEAELSRRSAAFRTERRPVTLDEVRRQIPRGAALVEIFAYEPFRPDVSAQRRFGEPRYVAYVLDAEGGVRWADLGEAAAIDAAVAKLREALANPGRDPGPAARALDALVMRPIEAQLGAARWVQLSPDGALNLVPFGALVDPGGRFRIERWEFTYLGSGRDLLRWKEPSSSREAPLVIGAPDFGERPVSRAPSSGGATGQVEARGRRSMVMARVRFSALPATAAEARGVVQALPGARLLLGQDATEQALKAVRGPRVLHLATHGFFLPEPQCGDGAEAAFNPLLCGGLAFAGANRRDSGGEDGILTALEASGLDLQGTRLVNLSACDTGIGVASRGGGVYGLRRALAMAGAETQVLSLWRVDDAATRDLMRAYYSALGAGGGRSAALRRAQLEALARPETRHPFYWAAFILSGDAAALDGRPVLPDLGQPRPGPRGCGCDVGGAGRGAVPAVPAALVALAAWRRRRGPSPAWRAWCGGPSIRRCSGAGSGSRRDGNETP